MVLADLFLVFGLVGIAAIWWHDRGIKQLALKHAKYHCEQRELQLLDGNVHLTGIKLKRDQQGRLCLQRKFGFEFTSTGERRSKGFLIMRGRKLEEVYTGVHLV